MESNANENSLALIAGKGAYPLLLARSARDQGVKRIFAIAFKRETDPAIEQLVDEVKWIHVGKLRSMLSLLKESGISQAVMAGQITPSNLFHLRPDLDTVQLLASLKVKNAESIFGAIACRLSEVGVTLEPASLYMESAMPNSGLLSKRAPNDRERVDIQLGANVAKATSELDVGQTVVVKEGTVLAVEAFEGTDETIRRAGRVGGRDAVVVKVAKRGHDMRFDIPVVGLRTLKMLKRIRASVLAVEADRTILLEKEKIIDEADRLGLCLMAVDLGSDLSPDDGQHGVA